MSARGCSCVVRADGFPEEQSAQGLGIEGNQRIEIPLPHQGLGRSQKHHNAHDAQYKSPYIKGSRHQQQCHTQQLKRISHLIAGLGKARQGYEGHIHQYLRAQPPGLHRKISQNQSAQQGERIGQGVRCVQGG